jgi:hypothetical protein
MIFDIPSVPPSLNVQFRSHWSQKQVLKNEWMAHIRSQFLPNGAERRKMRVTITLYHSRPYDFDNAVGSCKVIVDVLRHYKLLVNDTAEWIDLEVRQEKCAHAKRHTVVELEPA